MATGFGLIDRVRALNNNNSVSKDKVYLLLKHLECTLKDYDCKHITAIQPNWFRMVMHLDLQKKDLLFSFNEIGFSDVNAWLDSLEKFVQHNNRLIQEAYNTDIGGE